MLSLIVVNGHRHVGWRLAEGAINGMQISLEWATGVPVFQRYELVWGDNLQEYVNPLILWRQTAQWIGNQKVVEYKTQSFWDIEA